MSDELNYIERIAELIIKQHRDEITESEYQELMNWRNMSDENLSLFEKLSHPDYIRHRIQELPDIQALKKAGWEKVMAVIDSENTSSSLPLVPVRRISPTRYFVAASVTVLLVAGAWLYSKRNPAARSDISATLASNIKNDVAPGGNKAVLTLSDGSSVVLDCAGKGTIAKQGVTRVVKLDDGKLAYNSSSEKSTALVYNTLTTPAAGQFQVVLPDGSKVWLNNASSLRYPVAFTGKDREVELKGEAYFEIAPNANQPFKVKVGETLVDVLGTSFNISAYAEESNIKTTLLSGGVRVSNGGTRTVLKPGEQALVSEAGDLKTIEDVDVDGAVAWKNGLFHFERADIRTVMRMLARWYDVTVTYEGPVTDRLFGGEIERKLNLSQVLEILQKNQVHFGLEGRRITVKP